MKEEFFAKATQLVDPNPSLSLFRFCQMTQNYTYGHQREHGVGFRERRIITTDPVNGNYTPLRLRTGTKCIFKPIENLAFLTTKFGVSDKVAISRDKRA